MNIRKLNLLTHRLESAHAPIETINISKLIIYKQKNDNYMTTAKAEMLLDNIFDIQSTLNFVQLDFNKIYIEQLLKEFKEELYTYIMEVKKNETSKNM